MKSFLITWAVLFVLLLLTFTSTVYITNPLTLLSRLILSFILTFVLFAMRKMFSIIIK